MNHATVRERKKAPAASKTAALRWAEARERVLLVQGKPKPTRNEEVQQTPTLREFAGRFLDGYACRLTKRLTEALRQARHLRGARVLCDAKGMPLTQKVVQVMMRKAARRANVKPGTRSVRTGGGKSRLISRFP